jgi:folate-dependent phosphoribosylglycinamide formyltransferase PurN
MINVGILCENVLSKFSVNVLTNVINNNEVNISVAVINQAPKKNLIQKIKKNLKKGRGGYILIMACQKLFSEKEKTIKSEVFCAKNEIEVVKTKNPYSEEIVSLIRSHNLDLLLLINGYGIIKAPLLNVAKHGILSYHHGDMRKYRGMPPGLWELYNNEKEMGVTVQLLDKGLDCGIPVEERKIRIEKKDSLSTLKKRILNESEEMMSLALLKVVKEDYKGEKLKELGKIYTLPNLRQWLTLQLKLFTRNLSGTKINSK